MDFIDSNGLTGADRRKLDEEAIRELATAEDEGEDALRAELVRVTAERDQLRAVWVLSYLNPSDEHDNGVLGVYTTEQLARDSAIAKAVEGDLNLLGKRVFWQGDTLMCGDRGQSYPVRLCWSVDRWEVLGS